jgi:hypothetical protein
VFRNRCRLRKVSVKMTLEARLVQAHVMLQVISKNEHGSKFVSLARHGAYEVRLVEPAVSPVNFLFWIELFDCSDQVSVDSGGANDLEEAATIADEFAVRATELNRRRFGPM